MNDVLFSPCDVRVVYIYRFIYASQNIEMSSKNTPSGRKSQRLRTAIESFKERQGHALMMNKRTGFCIENVNLCHADLWIVIFFGADISEN